MLFCPPLIFFKINFFEKKSFTNTIRVSNSLDPDQVRHFVGPDLGPNCLQRLSAVGKEIMINLMTKLLCILSPTQ